MTNTTARLRAEKLRLAYDGRTIVDDLDLDIPDGRVTAVIGPNGCGKSTTLRALGRLLKPRAGSVILDGELIDRLPTRDVARTIGVLPQSPIAPGGLTVAELAARGRHPHQSWYRPWSEKDEAAVTEALSRTELLDLRERQVDELSGGQRQRAWIAMVLAQGTDLLLLDEPTTFLDLAHQIDVLDLVRELNGDGHTVVMVLHDLNLAARYAHHLVAMRDGRVAAQGTPDEVLTAGLVRDVFGLDAQIIADPSSGTPMVIPLSRVREPRSIPA
ncbi:iron complex transport system ATP-binding protein [Actinocorallia herbida]|uniref:Iron complex transport system ATP-binding protein n=1 Tax=Actinocorallia herbida TaxID=58109 RepID=A0A3N1CT80_9ACTN|nr:ABC transporter ATP-binding protein [Actinocorallia herbida]ROO84516.1 iron complex transport system ATP-binding protein [Actinocorallia herbida]